MARTQRTRNPLQGEDSIGLAFGQVIGDHKMKKHFKLTITEKRFSYTRREESIAIIIFTFVRFGIGIMIAFGLTCFCVCCNWSVHCVWDIDQPSVRVK